MQSTLEESSPDAIWFELAPHLDDAMEKLGATDRDAVVLRYFENKSLAEVGTALGMEERAAQKRVNRALEKLRTIFSKRGVMLSATIIASAVSANSVMAAPIGLASAITATAAKGTLIPATITTLVKGTMKTMTWLKIKFGVGVVIAALVAGGALTMAVSQASSSDRKFSGDVILQKSQDAYAALTSYSDEGKSVTTMNDAILTNAFSMKLARPNLYRIEWGQPVLASSYTNKGVVWSAGKGDFLIMGDRMAVQQKSMESALSSASGISGAASTSIAATFFKMNWVNQFSDFTASREQNPDEKVGNVDCYVFTGELGKGKISTIWIGKQDFLIRQVRVASSPASVKATNAEAAKHHPRVAAQLLKMRFGWTTSTETHENIVVNQKFSPENFAR
jgi:outer membrane lipoprotein-sorting protein